VSKTAVVSLHGNRYQAGPATAGRRVELVFGPFDLTVLFVRCDGKDAGTAAPHHITRHSHPKARPEDPGSGGDAPRATGVDSIALLGEQHHRQAERPVSYRALMPAAGHGGAPACEQQEQQGRDGHRAGQEDGRG
jgi:putative transposase